MSATKKQRCPRCGHRKFAMMKGGKLRCVRCSAVHDPNPEGIFATHNDPVRSAEFAERHNDLKA